ncbi:MAG: hypothetical protein KatS3mg030_437 [Saprospiraceae bacterium]|nr:MAG: hypothetical protein KatS3mg030_437 [Saprospiraceae bacterium]
MVLAMPVLFFIGGKTVASLSPPFIFYICRSLNPAWKLVSWKSKNPYQLTALPIPCSQDHTDGRTH